MAEFAEIARDQRINWREVGCGDACVLAGKHQEEMFDIVFGEDGYRIFLCEFAIEESLGDVVYGVFDLRVGFGAPFAAGLALSYADFLRHGFGPVGQAVGQDIWVGA